MLKGNKNFIYLAVANKSVQVLKIYVYNMQDHTLRKCNTFTFPLFESNQDGIGIECVITGSGTARRGLNKSIGLEGLCAERVAAKFSAGEVLG